MRKLQITLCFLFVGALSMSAQMKFGVKAGINNMMASSQTSEVLNKYNVITHQLEFVDISNAYNVGVFTKSTMGYIFFQSELLFNTYETEYKVRSFIDDNDNPSVIETNKNVNLQFIAGVTRKNFRLGVGPIFSYSLDFDSPLASYEFITDKSRALKNGFQGIIGYDFGMFHLDVNYTRLFNTVGDHIFYGSEDSEFDSKISSIGLSLGVGF